VAVLLSYVAVTFLLSWSATPGGLLARRLGLGGGLLVGMCMVVGNTPASPFGTLMRSPLGPITPLVASLAVAAVAASWTGTRRAGIEAALWTGLLSSLLFCVGLMGVTYGATGWFTSDPTTIANLAVSRSPLPAYDIATSLIRDTGETAFLGLLVGPIFAVTFGVVGAALGVGLARVPAARHA
jgi:hypothetical protein